MNKEQRLKHEALEAATFRGHDMTPFKTLSPTLFESECRGCSKYVQVDLNPAPNGIDIGGTAVALGCDG